MNVFNIYVYENRSMSNDLSRPLMLENLNVDNAQIHIPKEIDGTDMGTWAWWLVYQNAKREKYSVPMTLEGITNDEGEEEYISTVSLNHGFTGKHGMVMYAIEALQADGSGTVTHEWHTRTYKLEIVTTLQGNQTEYSETESDIISALISRVNELITSGAEIAEIAATIEAAAETAQEVIDSIPADYSTLSAQVDTNTKDIGELKADLGDNVNDLKSAISSISALNNVSLSFVEGGYASYNNKDERIISTSATARYAEISITEKYTAYHVITAVGGSIKAVLFFDASDKLVSFVSPESDLALQEFYVEVPDTASKMYINSIKMYGAFVDSQVEQILTASTMEGRQNTLSATVEQDVNYFEMGDHPYNIPITEIGTYNAIIKNSLNIDATTNTNYVLKKYPVSSDQTYRVIGDDVSVHYDTYGIAVFSTTSYDGTTSITGTTAIIGTGTGATNTDYDVEFTAPSNGYIYIMRYGTQNYCEVYGTEYNSALINRLTNTTTDTIKIQAFGDSITDDSWRSDETTWLTLLPDFLTQRTLSIKNEAVGGSHIGHGKVNSETGKYHDLDYNYVYDLMTNPTIFDPNSNIIVMFVGTNDFNSGVLGQWGDTSVDTFYGAARTICEYVAANTSALFLVVTPIARPDDADTDKAVNADGERINSNGATLRDYADALIRTCNFYQFPVIDLFHDIGWNKTNARAYLDSVGVHPSKKGSAVISAYISSVMKKHLGI